MPRFPSRWRAFGVGAFGAALLYGVLSGGRLQPADRLLLAGMFASFSFVVSEVLRGGWWQ